MEVKVAGLLGMRDLVLRSWADELFTSLAKRKSQVFILDFSNIEFVSRSFAHEYLKEKKSFGPSIREKNMNANVKHMFELAAQLPIKQNTRIVRSAIIQNL